MQHALPNSLIFAASLRPPLKMHLLHRLRSSRTFSTAVLRAPTLQEYPVISPPYPPLEASVFLSSSKYPSRRGRRHGAGYSQEPGTLSSPRTVPPSIDFPPYAKGAQPRGHPEPQIHSLASQGRMRRAGAVAAEVLAAAGELVKPGMSPDQIDDFVHRLTLSLGAYPSPLGYMGFPRSVCCSINEVVCHGIPYLGRVIQPGDIVKLDVSCYIGGVHGDTCRTWVAGEGDGEGAALVSTTKAALDRAVAACGPGMPVSRIGDIVGGMAEAAGYEVVTAFAGHGIGEVFHTNPIVYHHPNDSKYVLKEGMTFTIEPMIVEGTSDVGMWPDGWGVLTTDGGRAAQFEHTLLVTSHGVEVLTKYE